MKKDRPVPLKVLAARILAHLQRFERDPRVNAPRPTHGNTGPYFEVNAFATGAYIRVVYIAYQGGTNIRRNEAIRYLARLDAGFEGRHFEALRTPQDDATPKPTAHKEPLS